MSLTPLASELAVEDASPALFLDLLVALAERWKLLLVLPLLAGSIGLGITYVIPPTFTARTAFLPPQQQQSAATSALASLGGLVAAAGGAAGLRNPADQFVSLMQSETVLDRLVDRFNLMEVYEVELRREARRLLVGNSKFSAGKKDGIVVVEVDDKDPQRAAAIAHQYVEELRALTSTLVVTEAQQRRVFFEAHLEKTRDDLKLAQQQLQGSGFDAGALRAEPKAAAEEYARLKAEVTTAEVRLQTLRSRLTSEAPEVRHAQSVLSALRVELSRLEKATESSRGADYISRFRDFKYQEVLFELFARQYELARIDESREGSLIQVIDVAKPPEWKSRPRRAFVALASAAALFVGAALFIVLSHLWRRAAADPATAPQMLRLRSVFRRG